MKKTVEDFLATPRWKARAIQFDFLVKEGLKPHHYFLDVGCGWLRSATLFIPYLEKGHYYGFDPNYKYMWDAWLTYFSLHRYEPNLFQIEDWNIEFMDRKFDFALAQSVWTHIAEKDVRECMKQVIAKLGSDGRFYTTFFQKNEYALSPKCWSLSEYEAGGKVSADPSRAVIYAKAWYPAHFILSLGAEYGLRCKISDWISGQKMACYRR